jgi:DNA-directed RNA polymerase subunit M/transcription elongation factor TFIIS
MVMMAFNRHTLTWHNIPQCPECDDTMIPKDKEFKEWVCVNCEKEDEPRQSDTI